MSGVMSAPNVSARRSSPRLKRQQNHCGEIVSSLKSCAKSDCRRARMVVGFSPPIREVLVNKFVRLAGAAAIASAIALPAKAADITVGLVTSMTGPGASIGIPYAKGAAAGVVYKDEVNGIKINLDPARRRLRSVDRHARRPQADRAGQGRRSYGRRQYPDHAGDHNRWSRAQSPGSSRSLRPMCLGNPARGWFAFRSRRR